MSFQLWIVRKQDFALVQVLELRDAIVSGGALLGLRRSPNIFHQNCGFVTAPIAMSKSRNQTPGVDFNEFLWLLVRVHFDVLVVELLQLE